MRPLQLAGAVLLAFLGQTLIARYLSPRRAYFDLFLLAAAGFGLTSGRVTGMIAGTTAGLVQDAFSGGMLGINGLSKTTIGYVSGIVGNRLIIRGWAGRFAFFVLASLADLLILLLVGFAVERPLVWGEGVKPLYVCLGNGFVGSVVLSLYERVSARR